MKGQLQTRIDDLERRRDPAGATAIEVWLQDAGGQMRNQTTGEVVPLDALKARPEGNAIRYIITRRAEGKP